MTIDGNPKEKEAMAAYQRGDRAEGHRLQTEFITEFREEYQNKDHCPCKVACRYHVPNCMRDMLNQKIRLLSGLTEHSIANEIEPPKEIKLKK